MLTTGKSDREERRKNDTTRLKWKLVIICMDRNRLTMLSSDVYSLIHTKQLHSYQIFMNCSHISVSKICEQQNFSLGASDLLRGVMSPLSSAFDLLRLELIRSGALFPGMFIRRVQGLC